MIGFSPSIAAALALLAAPGGGIAVEVEEAVAPAAEPGNGAGPLWCFGAPLIVRAGGALFASIMEVGAGDAPPSNTRWRLLRRSDRGWAEVARADQAREREPCPLAWAGSRSGLLLSINPALESPSTRAGRSDPHLLRFDVADPARPPAAVRPPWPAPARFTEHSYRGLAADHARGDALALNIDAATEAHHWAYLPGDDRPPRVGSIRFPIRSCYPQVALRDGAGHVLALGDIPEPVAAWHAQKESTRPRGGDYVFRRIFHARADDLRSSDFAPPIEVDTVEATGGDLRNLDLWLDAAGSAHLLYLKTSTVADLRDRFFPGRPVAVTLEHAVVDPSGRLDRRPPLVVGGEGRDETPLDARFHAAADGTLHAVVALMVPGTAGIENRLIPVEGGGSPARIELQTPFVRLFTATGRGGSPPSDTLDLFGQARSAPDLRYARVRLR